MNQRIVSIAAKVMKVSEDVAMSHCKEIPDLNAYYFWNPVRGGIAVIVNEEGEKLGATSSISYQKHLQAFIDGKRN